LLCSETRQRGVRVGGPVERGERLPRPLIGAVGIGDPEHVQSVDLQKHEIGGCCAGGWWRPCAIRPA
jgi:hypothetical protein